jgi:hypothetical protein
MIGIKDLEKDEFIVFFMNDHEAFSYMDTAGLAHPHELQEVHLTADEIIDKIEDKTHKF